MASDKLITFEKLYGGDDLSDLDRDVSESFCESYNPLMKDVPVDEHGFHEGRFKVTIEWLAE